MRLWRDTRAAVTWYLRVMKTFLQAHPLVTVTSTVLFTLSEFMNLLAFFLPLKVLILAGSTGVPWYFAGFIAPEDKAAWVIGLAAAAVVAYFLTLVLQSVSDRLADRGGVKVLAMASEIGGTQRQRDKASSYYSRLCEIASGLFFSIMVFGVLGFLNLPLVLTLLGLSVLQFFATMVVLGNDAHVEPSRLQELVLERTAELTKFFSSLTFLVCFVVLLVPFVTGQQANVIVAILSVLIIRFGLQRSAASVQYLVSMYRARHLIDPLVFRDRKIERPDLPADQALHVLFEKQARDERAAGEALGTHPGATEVSSTWIDPAVPGVYRFEISGLDRTSGAAFKLLKLSFARHRAEWPEHEEILFNFISRSALAAPPLVSSFTQGGLPCQILEVTGWEAVDGADWPDLEFEIFKRIWSLNLPQELVAAYRTSHQILRDRLTTQAVRKALIAMDTHEERDLLDEFCDRLPDVLARIDEVPLFPVNPDINRHGVLRNGDEFRILSWFRWSLEPNGFLMPRKSSDEDLEMLLEPVRAQRSNHGADLTVPHLRLVASCKALDGMLMRMAYKQALGECRKILANPLLSRDG